MGWSIFFPQNFLVLRSGGFKQKSESQEISPFIYNVTNNLLICDLVPCFLSFELMLVLQKWWTSIIPQMIERGDNWFSVGVRTIQVGNGNCTLE